MRKILLIGAGRSASSLIKYLLENAEAENWALTVGDISLDLAKQKINNHPKATAIAFDVNNEIQRVSEIKQADIIISMLPASMHFTVAKDCVTYKKNLVTASYVSKELAALNDEAVKNGVLLLNEIGLDPGIDHLSAMQVINNIKKEGGEITSFKSHCGGLVAPESNDNPWGYKFSWNPRNVILAGQTTAQYLHKGKLHFIPYSRIFTDIETIYVEGYGKFDAYANRDSLSYIQPYGIENAKTVLRGTLREADFCAKWNCLSALGITDDTFVIENANTLTYREFVESFVPSVYSSFENFLDKQLHISIGSDKYKAIEWLGILSDKKITLAKGTPAQILQSLLETKWVLNPHDKDMIVMQHQFEYTLKNTHRKITSSLVVKGDDPTYTAMAKTVGLPMAIATKLILNKNIKAKGVVIPLTEEFYNPILSELSKLGITFVEKEITT
jgi:saccharopine dehydrogenase-like NADP-dependent oxidoreductase